jgi:hypothetical protein
MTIRAWFVMAALAFPVTTFAKQEHVSSIRGDSGPIGVSAAECKAEAAEIMDDPSGGGYAPGLCKLRAAHKRVRARLIAAINHIVDEYAEYTNHDHAQNLPTTVDALQSVVEQCIRALDSQQYCHNIACLTSPEQNAIFCETKATEIADAILNPK